VYDIIQFEGIQEGFTFDKELLVGTHDYWWRINWSRNPVLFCGNRKYYTV